MIKYYIRIGDMLYAGLRENHEPRTTQLDCLFFASWFYTKDEAQRFIDYTLHQGRVVAYDNQTCQEVKLDEEND